MTRHTVLSFNHPSRRAADLALRLAGLNVRASRLLTARTMPELESSIETAVEFLLEAQESRGPADVTPNTRRAARALDELGAAIARERVAA